MPEIKPNPRTPDDDSLIQGKNWFTKKITKFIFRVTPKCTEMTRLISHEIDAPLPFVTRFKMGIHNLACCYCERYQKNLKFISSVLSLSREHPEKFTSAELSPEAKERIKQSLRDQL
jgi:hypothetical protein